MKKKVLRFRILKLTGYSLFRLISYNAFDYIENYPRSSAMRGARRYAKKYGYTEIKEK